MFEWLRQRFKHSQPSTNDLDEEERDARDVERKDQDAGRRLGEDYIRTYAEPVTQYRTDVPPLPADDPPL